MAAGLWLLACIWALVTYAYLSTCWLSFNKDSSLGFHFIFTAAWNTTLYHLNLGRGLCVLIQARTSYAWGNPFPGFKKELIFYKY